MYPIDVRVRRAVLVAATLSLSTLTLAGVGAQTPGAGAGDTPTAAAICESLGATPGMHGSMGVMGTPDAGMMGGHGPMGTPGAGMMTGQQADLMFIDAMIPHHDGAVAMARIALERGSHEEIRTLSQAIIDSQTTEIGQMREWRAAWYPDAPAMPMNSMDGGMGMGMDEDSGHGSMGHGMADEGTPGTTSGGNMDIDMDMDMGAELATLCESEGDAFDLAFIDAMIPHHRGAIQMATMAGSHAEHEEIRQLTADIISAQQTEIDQMLAWRQAWFPDAPALQD